MPANWLLTVVLFAGSQQLPAANVPPAVARAWTTTHAGRVEWRGAPNHTFEALFAVRGVRTGIRYDSTGHIIETRIVIGSFDLPTPVKQAVIHDLRGYQIEDTWRVDAPGARPQFIIECKRGIHAISARYDERGKVVTRTPRRATLTQPR